MKKIGVISDTHNCFDQHLKQFLAGVDEIWHAGDFGSVEIADQIARFKPLKGVYGNIDGGATRLAYHEMNIWECEDLTIAMTHIGGYPGRYQPAAYAAIKKARPGIFIAGHSHILKIQYDKTNDLLFVNPGAAGCSGFHKVRTAVRFEIDGHDIRNMEVGEWPKSVKL